MKPLFTLFLCLLLAASAAGQELTRVQDASGKLNYVNVQSNMTIPVVRIYEREAGYSEGLAAVRLNGKWGYIDEQRNMVIPCRFEYVYDFSEGLARVKLNGKWGYVNKQGNTEISFRYDFAYDFSEGLAAVKLNDKYGYIDRQGDTVIPCRYNYVNDFSAGLARVNLKKKWGYINKRGDWFDTEGEGKRWVAQQRSSFSGFAKPYVEERINAWQKKGEFEKTSDWQARVNETTRNRKIAEFNCEAEKLYIKEYASKTPLNYFLGRYDADNEVYLITGNDMELLVHVPIAEAPAFKQKWESVVKTPKYFIENDRLAVAEVTFTMPGGKTYRYSNAASLQYTMAEVSYNFDPIEISVPETTAPAAGRQTVNRVTVTAGKSDVDVNIPQGRTTRDRTFAVIIANENYTKLSPVAYALNDGKTFGQYCRQTLGLPETNIRYYGDATYGTMLAAMSDIKKIATAYEGDIEVLFYYAGHGAPDEQQEAYLMPVDAYGVGSEACYSLARLYKELGGLGARRVTVFLDACFSGSTREGTMLASARGVAIKPRSASPTGNMVVFTAAQGDETALPYRTQGHGLFTYYLLKKLQESEGEVTFGELGDYLTEQVSRRSQVVNRKSQTPAVLVSPSLGATWQTTPLVQ